MGGQSSKTCETHLIISFFSGENKKKVQGRKVTRENLVSCDEDININKRHFEICPDGPKLDWTISVEAGQKYGSLTWRCEVLVFSPDTRQ